jgi:ATP-dependent DNA ligase
VPWLPWKRDPGAFWGRELADYTPRYPELDVLQRLPAGTVLDGELVLLRSGRADLQELMRRHQLAGARKIQEASRRLPATYVVFDLVYHGGRPLWGRPLVERRELLAELLDQHPDHGLVLSDGVAGSGRTFFDKVVQQGHEGVMAKHLKSRYLPGRRVQAGARSNPSSRSPASSSATRRRVMGFIVCWWPPLCKECCGTWRS